MHPGAPAVQGRTHSISEPAMIDPSNASHPTLVMVRGVCQPGDPNQHSGSFWFRPVEEIMRAEYANTEALIRPSVARRRGQTGWALFRSSSGRSESSEASHDSLHASGRRWRNHDHYPRPRHAFTPRNRCISRSLYTSVKFLDHLIAQPWSISILLTKGVARGGRGGPKSGGSQKYIGGDPCDLGTEAKNRGSPPPPKWVPPRNQILATPLLLTLVIGLGKNARAQPGSESQLAAISEAQRTAK